MEEKEVLNTETAESMDDYKESIDASLKRLKKAMCSHVRLSVYPKPKSL